MPRAGIGADPNMSRTHPLERPFRRYARSFERNLVPATEGAVEPLHQCRVATRRLRELAPLLSAELGDKAVRKVRLRLRDVGRALGPVRELDVARGLLDELTKDGLTPPDAVVRLRQHIVDLRTEARRGMIDGLDRSRSAKLGKRLREIGDALGTGSGGAWSRTLSLRLSRRAQYLARTVEAAGAVYVPDRVHAVRIAAKKLRYTFELAVEAGATRRRVPVRQLKAVQDTLGRLHDIEVLASLIQAYPLPPPPMPVWVAHVDDFRHRLETECRRLHSEFIGDRRQLARAGAAATETAGRIWSRRPAADGIQAPLKMDLEPSDGAAVPPRRTASGR